MLLSIITVNLNNREGLCRTIDSVLSQSWRDFEWIIIDGGSTDGSRDLIEQQSEHLSYWCSEADRGIYHAMNKGILHATGDYCLFLNSGDFFRESSVLYYVTDELKDADFICGDMAVLDADSLLLKHYVKTPSVYHPGFLLHDHFPHQATFIRTSMLKSRLYDESILISADWEQMIYQLNFGGATYKHIPIVVSNMVLNGLSSRYQLDLKREHESIRNRYYSRYESDMLILQSLAQISTAESYYRLSYLAYTLFVNKGYSPRDYRTLFSPYKLVLVKNGPIHWRFFSFMSAIGFLTQVHFIYSWGKRILRRIQRDYHRFCDFFYSQFCFKPTLLSLEETIDAIISQHLSLARFGDGELAVMYGEDINFQQSSPQLQQKLRAVAESRESSLMIGIPDVFSGLSQYDAGQQLYWSENLHLNRPKWYSFLHKDQRYANAFLTRFYSMEYDSALAAKRLDNLKRLWYNRTLLIVEGKDSKLGVGNDLFRQAASIRRILCPSRNAFSCYDQIIKAIEKNVLPADLIILALGPTATVLAHDLCILGIQALDLGHVDIEYEWFRMNAHNKVSVPGKFTNEAIYSVHAESEVIGELLNPDFESQVILSIS